MDQPKKYDVFISYSRKDKKVVDMFVGRLAEAGFTIWIDKDGIESGDAFKHVIVNAIEQSKVVLFFSSEDSNKSIWTSKEIGVAIYENKPIIPVKLDKAKYNSEIKFDLINLDYIDLKGTTPTEEIFGRLIRTLRHKCDKTTGGTVITEKDKPEKHRQSMSQMWSRSRKPVLIFAAGFIVCIVVLFIIGSTLSSNDTSTYDYDYYGDTVAVEEAAVVEAVPWGYDTICADSTAAAVWDSVYVAE